MQENPKVTVSTATEKMNRQRLIDMCHSKKGEKTKTRHMLEVLNDESYEREFLVEIRI